MANCSKRYCRTDLKCLRSKVFQHVPPVNYSFWSNAFSKQNCTFSFIGLSGCPLVRHVSLSSKICWKALPLDLFVFYRLLLSWPYSVSSNDQRPRCSNLTSYGKFFISGIYSFLSIFAGYSSVFLYLWYGEVCKTRNSGQTKALYRLSMIFELPCSIYHSQDLVSFSKCTINILW